MRFMYSVPLLTILGASPALAHDGHHPHVHFEWAALSAVLIIASVFARRRLRSQASIRDKSHCDNSEA